MFATVVIVGAALGAVGLGAWWLLRHRSMSSGQSIGVVAVSMWIAASGVVAWRLDVPEETSLSRQDLMRSLSTMAWPTSSPGASSTAQSPDSAGVQAASVESLVGGLEARLAAQPNDAEGWALLAQSYAFTSNEEAVERAVNQAVALGFDEQALRERVTNAQRSAPAFDWADRALQVR